MNRAEDSAVGTDSVPYSAWKATGRCGAGTLAAVSRWMMGGLMMPLDFYASENGYRPKGIEDGSEEEDIDAASETLPIALKNSGN